MITATLSGDLLPPIELDFIDTPLENAVDVVTLSGEMYTDFTSQQREWTFNYDSLAENEYDEIREKYDAQFVDYQYPTLTIPHYSVADKPVRMYINEKSIWKHCGDVKGVQLKFRETSQLPEVS